MNPGGGPDRDDTGLPPVDIEIPDDARELDRDVQAYRREVRAQRRRKRSMRTRGALSRDGMIMPLLICCLIFALVTGTLLTLFTATPIDSSGLPGSANPSHPAPAATTPSAAATAAPGRLAAAMVAVAGRQLPVRSLRRAILLVGTATCHCDTVVAQLAVLAAHAHEATYLVAANPAGLSQSARLAGQLGDGLRPASDVAGVLDGTGYPHSGLTAVLVSRSGSVTYRPQVLAGADLAELVASI